jgi:hypothetical protein
MATNPVKPTARFLKAFTVSCPTCRAGVGQPCTFQYVTRKVGQPMGVCHHERIELIPKEA